MLQAPYLTTRTGRFRTGQRDLATPYVVDARSSASRADPAAERPIIGDEWRRSCWRPSTTGPRRPASGRTRQASPSTWLTRVTTSRCSPACPTTRPGRSTRRTVGDGARRSPGVVSGSSAVRISCRTDSRRLAGRSTRPRSSSTRRSPGLSPRPDAVIGVTPSLSGGVVGTARGDPIPRRVRPGRSGPDERSCRTERHLRRSVRRRRHAPHRGVGHVTGHRGRARRRCLSTGAGLARSPARTDRGPAELEPPAAGHQGPGGGPRVARLGRRRLDRPPRREHGPEAGTGPDPRCRAATGRRRSTGSGSC